MFHQFLLFPHEKLFYVGMLIKALGYTLFLKWWFKQSLTKTTGLAFARAITGGLTGMILIALMGDHPDTRFFYFGVFMIRFIEWILFSKAFNNNLSNREFGRFIACAQTLSVVLDVIFFIAGYKIMGGIC